jgi:hypothetical protein
VLFLARSSGACLPLPRSVHPARRVVGDMEGSGWAERQRWRGSAGAVREWGMGRGGERSGGKGRAGRESRGNSKFRLARRELGIGMI